jgi:hypothetical protein
MVTCTGARREDYGTQSLQRIKASIIYKATGNLRAVRILLGHTKIETLAWTSKTYSRSQSTPSYDGGPALPCAMREPASTLSRHSPETSRHPEPNPPTSA